MRIDPKKIVKRLKENNGLVRKTARDLQISPGTVIYWRNKARSGLRGYLKYQNLKRLSTCPKNKRKTIIKAENQDRITLLKKRKGFCAVKIRGILKLEEHPRTIHRFLKYKGLVNSEGYHRRPKFQETTHMHTKNAKTLGKLQMDVKYVTPELSGLEHTCYLYACMDILSRYKQGIIYPLLDQSFSIEAIKWIMPILPFLPDFIQTDNGLEFQKRFKVFCEEEYRLKYHYIHKSNPNENAVIERSFRTDEEEFFFRLDERPKDIIQLNLMYQEYIKEYNEWRPHLGLNLKTPIEVVHQQLSVQ
jgi:transposase InsO family protein